MFCTKTLVYLFSACLFLSCGANGQTELEILYPPIKTLNPAAADFYAANKRYSDVYIQNSLDEMPDVRLLSQLQSEKRLTNKKQKEAKLLLVKAEDRVQALKNKKQSLEEQKQKGKEVESELVQVVSDLNLAEQKRLQALRESEQAKLEYEEAANNYADHSADIKAKMDLQVELEDLSDQALNDLYSNL